MQVDAPRSNGVDARTPEETMVALTCWLALGPAHAEEPDHAIHEELREVVRTASEAIDEQRYEDVLPLLTEDFRGTTLTQDPIRGRDGVKDHFDLWFGPDGYMDTMSIQIQPDALTELSDDRSWGLVVGGAKEHYVAKDGNVFDFDSRWTTVMVRDDDGQWRVRAIHFGTNHLDNPVLWKVRDSMILYGGIGAAVLGVGIILIGVVFGRWSKGEKNARTA